MRRNIYIVVLIMIGQIFGASGVVGAAAGNPLSSYPSAYEEDPRRLEWQMPDKVMEVLAVRKGDVVADIGAGTGFFTMRFARQVGGKGRVYAVDIDEDMVRRLEARAAKEGATNVTGILARPDDPLLPKSSVDLIFICDTYMFIENREQYLLGLKGVLKSGGRLAILSFNESAEMPGAPPRHKIISRERTIREAGRAGFKLDKEYFFIPMQDFMVFVKK